MRNTLVRFMRSFSSLKVLTIFRLRHLCLIGFGKSGLYLQAVQIQKSSWKWFLLQSDSYNETREVAQTIREKHDLLEREETSQAERTLCSYL